MPSPSPTAHRLLAIALVCLLAPGCSTTPSRNEAPVDAPPISTADPLIPVNLHINPGDWVTKQEAGDLRHLREQIEKTRLFASLAPGGNRWPVSMEIRYSHRNTDSTAKEIAKSVVSGASLFIVPTQMNLEYTLQVTLYSGPETIEQREYKIQRSSTIHIGSLFGGMEDLHWPAIDELVSMLQRDFISQPPLPTLRSLQPSPETSKPQT